MVVDTVVGGVLFAAFLVLCWYLFIRRLWERGSGPPAVRTAQDGQVAFGDPDG